MNKIKNVSLRKGGYSVGIVAVVLAIIVVINLLVGKLPVSLTQFDISSTNIYDISDTTISLLDELEDDITITVLADPDSIDTMVSTFLDKYTQCSSHLTLEYVDTVLHPSAPETYGAEDNSVVVKNETSGSSTSFLLSDMYEYDEMSYYYYGSTQYTAFDGEGQLTSAINQVTSGAGGKIYLTEGHGEGSFSEALSDLLSKSNISVDSVNTMTASEIPDDCDVLVINGAGSDLTKDEIEAIDQYLAGGGHVTVLLSNSSEGLSNLYALINEYGLNVEDGYVSDSSRGYQGNGFAIVPVLSLDESLSDNMDSDSVLVYGVYGMTEWDTTQNQEENDTDASEAKDALTGLGETDVQDSASEEDEAESTDADNDEEKAENADADTDEEETESTDSDADEEDVIAEYEAAVPTVTAFMSTSENATLLSYEEDQENANGTGYKETELGSGTYMLGAYSVKGDGRLTIYTGSSIIDSSITDSFPSLQNLTLFMNSLTANMEDVSTITIEAKSLETEQNSVSNTGFISLILIIVLPLGILFWGFTTWRKRRKA